MCLAAAQAPSSFASGPWNYFPPKYIPNAVFGSVVPAVWKEVFDAALATHGLGISLKNIPEDCRTPDLCRAAVLRDAYHELEYVPEEHIPALYQLMDEILESAWLGKPATIQVSAIQANAVQAEAIRRSLSVFFRMLPKEYKTYELCLAAVKNSPGNYNLVPKEFETREMVFSAADYFLPVSNIPEEFKTPELWLYAVQHNGRSLCSVPEEERTVELCLTALNAFSDMLNYRHIRTDIIEPIPITMREEICALFLDNNPPKTALSSETPPVLTSEELKKKGNKALEENDLSGAIAAYTMAIREVSGASNDWRFFNNRGIAYRRLGEYDNALKDYHEAQRLSPTAMGYYNLGLVYCDLEDYAKARESYLQALKLDPANENALAALSELDKHPALDSDKFIGYDEDDCEHQAEGIQGIYFPDGITLVGGTFSENEIVQLIFPSGVTVINAEFSYNQIESVQLPESLTEIGAEVFLDNQLEEIFLPDSLTEIGDGAFCANKLSSVHIPGKLRYILENVFSDNEIEEVDLDDAAALEGIATGAFYNNKIQHIDLKGVKNIGNGAFDKNPLTLISIGSNVNEENDPPFAPNTFGIFGESFVAAYMGNGRKGGIYFYDAPSGTWKYDGNYDNWEIHLEQEDSSEIPPAPVPSPVTSVALPVTPVALPVTPVVPPVTPVAPPVTPTSVPVPQTAPSIVPAVTAAGTTCTQCGAYIADGIKFCSSCGTKVSTAPENCLSCGAKLNPGAQFCSSCGAKISAAPAPASARRFIILCTAVPGIIGIFAGGFFGSVIMAFFGFGMGSLVWKKHNRQILASPLGKVFGKKR
ncbi:leucine-rich repeat protein [Treponema primitia]|uniref:leucine-rich repeat protein n=1 Tax=Treponema primitia TaxID=88058 RepID=UPI001E5BDEAC|nr:leucine-rich repeat protein [Treponema primitia]